MEYTQVEMLKKLEELERNKWNIRQMTALRSEKFLPPLRQWTLPGTNKHLNFWDETDIDQIVDVYDWWEYCHGDRVTLTLILWLQGYNIPLNPLRKFYIHTIKMYLKKLTGGKTDPDEILDKVSGIVLEWMRKMRYTPGLADQRRKMTTKQNFTLKQMEIFIESLLSALVVPNQEFEDEEELEETSTDYAEEEEFSLEFEDVAAILRDIFLLPNLLDVVKSATIEQWEQAGEDFLSICQLFSEFSANFGNSPFPEVLTINWTLFAAVWLLVPLLSVRYRGYGQLIDTALKKLHELLADPEVKERMRNRERMERTTEAEVGDNEKSEISISE